jgi:hypothetical protein
MKLAELLISPPPPTGWSLDRAVAAVVRRRAKEGLRGAALEVPEGTFEIGPMGLQAVDEDRLRPLLTRLQTEVAGSRRASVVLPTGWLRTHLLEFDALPRRQADQRDIVLWRLKKLLPAPPSSLRLTTVPLPPVDERKRLLVLVGVERALAGLEAVFESVEVSPAIITPRFYALAGGGRGPSPLLRIQQERGFLALLLLVDDAPRLVRTKPLAGDDWSTVELELTLAMGFIESKLAIGHPLSVAVSAEDEAIGAALRGWVAKRPGLSPATGALPALAFDGTSLASRVGAFRLDPVVSLLAGGMR